MAKQRSKLAATVGKPLDASITYWTGWLAVPFLVFGIIAIAQALYASTQQFAAIPEYFYYGFCGALPFFAFVDRFQAFYVLGHELSHWLMAKLFLRKTGKLSSMKIRETGGSISVERPNVWIALAPYFIPFYAFPCLLLFWTWRWSMGDGGDVWILPLFQAALGTSIAYHLWMTLWVIFDDQQDLVTYGRTFSICLIVFMNLLGLYLILHLYLGDILQAGLLLGQVVQEQFLSWSQWLLEAFSETSATPGNKPKTGL